MTLELLHCDTSALPITTLTTTAPAPTPEDPSKTQCSQIQPTQTMSEEVKDKGRNIHITCLHALRWPCLPTTLLVTSQPPPLPEISSPPPNPAIPLPPSQIIPPTVSDAPADPAPPMPSPWPLALPYYNLAAAHLSPSALCPSPSSLSRALPLMLPTSSVIPPPNNKGMF
ncbi:hypothetical protein E4T56_gene6949 [Termitomyces sp. T112]|nr:hypothetical protein E4T56_gene6949 [Termitomyces sp. T112]